MPEILTREEMRAESDAMSACEDCCAIQDAMNALGVLSKRGMLMAVEYLRATGYVTDAQTRHEEAAHPRWRAEVEALIAKGARGNG